MTRRRRLFRWRKRVLERERLVLPIPVEPPAPPVRRPRKVALIIPKSN